MAQRHASSGDVIDVQAFGAAFHDHVTQALIKSAQLELVRLVLPAGKSLREHAVAGEITVLCVEGLLDFDASGVSHRLAPGQLIHLAAGVPHSLQAVTDVSALLTICLAAP